MHMGEERGIAYQLWKAIQEEQLRRGWTAVKMAEQTGVQRTTITRLKTGKRRPQAATIKAIADGLGWDYVDTAGLAGYEVGEIPPPPDDQVNDLAAIIASILEDPEMPQADKERFVAAAREDWEREHGAAGERVKERTVTRMEEWKRARSA